MTTIDAISGRTQTDRVSVRTSEQTGATIFAKIVAVGRWLNEAKQRRRGRNALVQMSEAQLKDIGITRMQAELEAAKPFWR